MKKFKVTNNNIKLRYMAELGKNPDINLLEIGEKFGVTKQSFWRWTSKNKKYAQLPNNKVCPLCKKSQYMKVYAWINDGSLDHLVKGKGE